MVSCFRRAVEILPRVVAWLWLGRIPLRALTVLDADPGMGKTTVIMDLAARVSAGKAMPLATEGTPRAGVVLLDAESEPSGLREQLEAGGADLERVLLLDRTNPQSALAIPDDIGPLEEAMLSIDARLVVLDPASAFVTSILTQERGVRQALGPLAALAERRNAAILLVRHLTKSATSRALYRGLGSIGVIAAARSGLLLAEDPGDTDRRVLAQVKSNLGPISKSLSLEISSRNGATCVEWSGPDSYSASELLEVGNRDAPQLREALRVLYQTLADGPVWSREALARAQDVGVSSRTLHRAKRAMGVVSQRMGFGPKGRVFWVLDRTALADALAIEDLLQEPIAGVPTAGER